MAERRLLTVYDGSHPHRPMPDNGRPYAADFIIIAAGSSLKAFRSYVDEGRANVRAALGNPDAATRATISDRTEHVALLRVESR